MSSLSIPSLDPRNPSQWDDYIWHTFSMDLDRLEGKITTARTTANEADTSDTNSDTLGIVMNFTRNNASGTDRWMALSDTGAGNVKALFQTPGTNPTDTWSVLTTDSAPTNCRDMTIFENDTRGDSVSQNQLFVATDCDVAVLNDTGNNTWTGNWWSSKEGHTADSGLDTGVPHPIEYFPFQRIVLLGSRNHIHTISRPSDTQNDTSAINRLTFPKDLETRHIFYTSNRAWILCRNLYGGYGKIIEWDGFSQTYNNIHNALGTTPLSGVSYGDVPIVVNNRGQILEYNGAGFSPMERRGKKVAFPVAEEWGGQITDIAPRGMTVGDDGLIYMNVRHAGTAGAAGTLSPRQNSGIWCLNPITGRLYSKNSFGQRVGGVGAIHALNPSVSQNGLLIGGSVPTSTDASTFASRIMTLASTTATSIGRFTTKPIPAGRVKEFWDSIWLRFKRIPLASVFYGIVVRAKGVTDLINASYEPLEATITPAIPGVSTNEFTLTLAAGDNAIAVGDMVEFLTGYNAGESTHITVISGAHAAVQTITVEAGALLLPTAGTQTQLVRFNRWRKLGTITTTSRYEDVLPIGIQSPFIQFQFELRGAPREMELDNVIVNFEPSIHTKR